ncbi:MAG: biliverdin-producing heme oxygenase [Pseudomonadota bacterium]
MSHASTARHALRSATADLHERVDRAYGRYDLSDVSQYTLFLKAQAAGLLPVECAIDRSPLRDIVPDWSERRRAHLLRADLAALGVAPRADGAGVGLANTEEVLGAVYVLEGARLGGAVLARVVPAHFPAQFLAGVDARRWRLLLDILERVLISPRQRAAAIDAACRVFALFEGGANERTA